ncbi:sugar ABC transporter permease [Desulfosporosinus sp. Sb-LF]|uniref:ABC transporter permease n=1 Tax=Desulfosporosinus sp. Sb-LF TaxID=2560027 RepID=UPI00107F45E4|nr:sugar ABC transporter permease [Desulfosporosinus sp. Sb-LF]TGE34584.1 sugar ABC transporter permease [Desulfosporosinus sp. Sb-LF]
MWQESKPYWLVLPAVIVIMILFFGGLIEGVAQSVGYFPAAGQFNFSTNAYHKLLISKDFWLALWLTLRISFLSTLLAGILGLGISLFFLRNERRKSRLRLWLQGLCNLPLVIPHFVGAYIMMLLLMQSGYVSRLCYYLGLIQQPEVFPVLTNDPTGWGVILTYTWKEAPFIALMVYPVLRKVYSDWQEVAKVFGAKPWQFFIEVSMPMLFPAWSSSCFIVFSFTFSAFEVPYLMGITYPKMLPVLSYSLYTNGGWNRMPEAMAINVLLTIITAFLGILAYKLNRRWGTPGRRS